MARRNQCRCRLRRRPRLLRPTPDRIYLPHPDQFDDAESFLATSLHEHVHWSGHRSRLDRLDLTAAFGDPEYATEELVAELGAAIAAARLGISTQPREDHAAYLAHWVDLLGEDPKILFRTAAAAQRAVDYLDSAAQPAEANSNETTA